MRDKAVLSEYDFSIFVMHNARLQGLKELAMRPYLLPLLAIVMVSSVSCVPRPPMDQSEFKGFCYQVGGFRGGDCDNISVCDTYLSVIDQPQKSLQACLQGCVDINRTNVYQTISAQCINVSQAGMDYCQRFCRGNYPEQPQP